METQTSEDRSGGSPDSRGRYGEFGGRYVPETLMHPVEELESAYHAARNDPAFHAELARPLMQSDLKGSEKKTKALRR